MSFVSVYTFSAVISGLLSLLPSSDPPVGIYRSAAQYHRRQPQPAATDVRRSDKKGSIVAIQQRGPGKLKIMVPLDSVWGYVSKKGSSFRLYQGAEYQIQQVDTITIYSNETMRQYMSAIVADKAYFFSRGLAGKLYPLNEKNLRLAYEASNPAFVASMKTLSFSQSLTDYDAAAGSYRVVQLYRASLPK